MGSGWRSGGNPSAPLLPSGGAYPSVDELPCALQEPAPPPPLTAPLLGTAASAPYSFSPAADAFAADMAVASAQVRAQFVAKVFALLLVQLAFVAGVALLLSSSAPALAASPALLLASAVVAVATTLLLSCSERARRAHPLNLVLLGIFSCTQGCLVAAATAGMARRVVLDAVVLSALVVAALALYALVVAAKARDDDDNDGTGAHQREFTGTDGMLLAALLCLLAVTAARALLPNTRRGGGSTTTVDLLISGCGALLFACYICHDVSLLARGDHRTAVGSPDDYVLAVLTIEVDVVNLLLYALDLLRAVEGGGGDDDG